VRAHLRHQEHAVAAIRDRLAHHHFRAAVVVLPRVVHEGDAGINGGMDEADRLALIRHLADVMAAEADRRHHRAGRAKRA
jgi:hypothetical protein